MYKTIVMIGICTFGMFLSLQAQQPSVSEVSTNQDKPVHVTSQPKLQVSEKIVPGVTEQPFSAGNQQPDGNVPTLTNSQPVQVPENTQKNTPVKPE